MTFRHTRTIAGRGLRDEQFRESLRGICVDAAGRLYAVGDDVLKLFDAEGKLVRRWKTAAPGLCVYVDRAGGAYVGEDGRVERWAADGAPRPPLRDGDRLGRVTAIGIAGDHVILADATNRRLRRYDARDAFVNDIGADNNTRGFLIPNGHLDFAIDAAGIIHAANPGKFRIERYTPAGERLGHFGRFGVRNAEDFPGCCNPTNIALAPDGRIAVTDKVPARAKLYDAGGRLLAVIGPDAFDQNGKNLDIAVDAKGRVYVADPVRLHVCVFEPVAGTTQGGTRP